jgi:uncharacterized protein (DUF2126 family)
LRALERMAPPGNPAVIDAMLRNLLMDWNGNTHRAELSVDKFWNAHAPNGKHGLIELRAFEMMPDVCDFLRVNVLIRALVAAFAERPYTRPLIPWREALHDRFALPCFLEQDFLQVLNFLNEHGFNFSFEWFQSHFDFRFPVVSRFEGANGVWELRQALEPWPVMGEQPVLGGTARSVDASTDRLQLRAWGGGHKPAGRGCKRCEASLASTAGRHGCLRFALPVDRRAARVAATGQGAFTAAICLF